MPNTHGTYMLQSPTACRFEAQRSLKKVAEAVARIQATIDPKTMMPPSSYRDEFALLAREALYAHGAVVQLQMALALEEGKEAPTDA